MAYGMTLYDSAGSVYYDSSSGGGVLAEYASLFITNTANTSYIYYPQYSGRTLRVLPLWSGDIIYKVFTSANLGYPYISYQDSHPTYTSFKNYSTVAVYVV